MLVFPKVEISTNRNGGKSNEQLLTKNSGLEQLLLYYVLVCFKGKHICIFVVYFVGNYYSISCFCF